MSNTKYPDHHVDYKKPNHRYNLNQRDDTDDEIGVFEATKYFAEDDQPVGRRSRIRFQSSPFRSNQSKQTKDQKPYHNKSKYKQEPVSPGGKLVSFLNSLFNQTSSSKKKKSTPSNIKDEDQRSHHDLGFAGRRKRRSRISHFPGFNNNSNKISTTSTAASPLLLYSSSLMTSGFRTPTRTKTKTYQNSPSDLVITTSKQELMFPNNLSKHSGRGSYISLQDQKMINRDVETIDVLYDKCKKINSPSESKDKDGGIVMRMQHDLDRDDDGGESDSSSDLFELQNYDLCVVNIVQ